MDYNFLIGLGISPEQAELAAAESERELADLYSRHLRDKYELAVGTLLERAGARNVKAASAALDYSWDGTDFELIPNGLSEAVETLSREAPYLFAACDGDGEREVYTFYGVTPAEESDVVSAISEMSYSEYMRTFKNSI